MQKDEPVLVGLLVDDPRNVSKYVYELAKWADDQPDLELCCIAHPRPPDDAQILSRVGRLIGDKGIYWLLSAAAFRLITWVESKVFKPSKDLREDRSFDISRLAPTRAVLSPLVSGPNYKFTPEDIGKVRALNLTVMIRAGSGILRGDILTAARYGILSFHHGDNRIFRGWPPGFWEVYQRWNKTGFVIQRLTETLDGGDVVCRGWFPTSRTYMRNQTNIFQKANPHLFNLLKRLTTSAGLPSAEPKQPYSRPVFTMPTLVQSCAYVAKVGRLALVSIRDHLLQRKTRWSISYVRTQWRSSTFARARTIPAPPGRFLADPFLIERNGKTYCFVEDYLYSQQHGRISVFEIGENGARELGLALDEPFHLSFPFLFEVGGEVYMCPESSAAREIRVYRCAEFPLRWELHAVLMRDVVAVDAMIFERADRWWMLVSINSQKVGDFSELHLFFANSPFSPNWIPHPRNPICIDCEIGRNAGLILDGDDLFRASQSYGFGFYGESLSLHKITQLSDTAYAEERVATIEPKFRPGIIGCHHISTTGKITVIDHAVRSSIN